MGTPQAQGQGGDMPNMTCHLCKAIVLLIKSMSYAIANCQETLTISDFVQKDWVGA